jgi:hypothetical protein
MSFEDRCQKDNKHTDWTRKITEKLIPYSGTKCDISERFMISDDLSERSIFPGNCTTIYASFLFNECFDLQMLFGSGKTNSCS